MKSFEWKINRLAVKINKENLHPTKERNVINFLMIFTTAEIVWKLLHSRERREKEEGKSISGKFSAP